MPNKTRFFTITLLCHYQTLKSFFYRQHIFKAIPPAMILRHRHWSSPANDSRHCSPPRPKGFITSHATTIPPLPPLASAWIRDYFEQPDFTKTLPIVSLRASSRSFSHFYILMPPNFAATLIIGRRCHPPPPRIRSHSPDASRLVTPFTSSRH